MGRARPRGGGLWRRTVAAVSVVVALSVAAEPAVAGDGWTWEQYEGCQDPKGTEAFVERFPDSARAAEGRACLERWKEEAAEWRKVADCGDVGRVESFLERYPEGRYAEQARECIDWGAARRCKDVETVRRFVRDHPESRYVGEANACLADLERERQRNLRVEGLLRECRAHRDANRLTAGVGGSALECYRKVLDEDPGNSLALDGTAGIEKHYVDKAHASLRNEAPEAVERSIARLETINPEHPEVETLRARIEELRHALADRQRIARESEALREAVESLIEQDEYEAALSRLEEGRKRGLSGKGLQALEKQAGEGLARKAAEAAAREREALVAEVRDLLGRGDFAGARSRLGEAREAGLDEETRGALAADIDAAEAAAREREAARLLESCTAYESSRRWRELQACARRVLELDAGHAEARRLEAMGETREAWERAKAEDTVESYHEFGKAYPGSDLDGAAQTSLWELEPEYWKRVEAEDTPEAYRRYLEIYPGGSHAAQARERGGG